MRDEIIERVKSSATVYMAAEICGFKLPKPGVKCKIPWRPDKNPSGSVMPGGRRLYDFSHNEGKDALDIIQEMRGVGFPVACNMLAEIMGLPSPFEDAVGTGKSRVIFGKMPEVVEEPQKGGVANFPDTMKDDAVDAIIRDACAALVDDEDDLKAISEWRGMPVEFVRELAKECRLGAVLEAGALWVMLPCAKVDGLWVRAQLRKIGPRCAKCERFWPYKSDHKPGLWVAQDGAEGGSLIVGEGWGDAAAGRLLSNEPQARIVATLGTSVRKLEGVQACAIVLLRQNESGDANERWGKRIRALFPTVNMKSALPPPWVKDWNDVLKKYGAIGGAEMFKDSRTAVEDELDGDVGPEEAGRSCDLLCDTLAGEIIAEITEGSLKHDAIRGWYELHQDGYWVPVPSRTAMTWAAKMAEVVRNEANEKKARMVQRAAGNRDQLNAIAERMKSTNVFAKACNSARGQESALKLAAARPDMHANFDPSNLDPWVLPVQNGIIDLRIGADELWRPFLPEDYVTWRAGAAFEESAEAPMWTTFIEDICDGDQEMINFLQRWAGYILTGNVGEQNYLFLYGMGANGKSTMVSLLQALMGDFSKVIPLNMVQVDKRGTPTPDCEVIKLKGARLVVPPELEKNARLAEANVKTLSGKDKLRGRSLYKESEEFAPTHKLCFFSNSKPQATGGDKGTWRRPHLVHLRKSFEGADRIKDLDEILKGELSGILNWCIAGCWDWQKAQGLNPPQSVLDEVQEYKEASDAIGAFLADHLKRDVFTQVPVATIRERIRKWADAEGEKWLAEISTRKLRKELEERGWDAKVDRNNQPYVLGSWTDGETAPWDEA
jgi:putative DNA primase/helicase